MTLKRTLEQLEDYKREAADLRKKIDNLPVIQDKTKGSMPEFPYIEVNYAIERVDLVKSEKLKRQLEKKLGDIQDAISEMEDFLSEMEDSELRMILRLRYQNGMTEEQVGQEIGLSRSGVNMKLRRFFEKQNCGRSGI